MDAIALRRAGPHGFAPVTGGNAGQGRPEAQAPVRRCAGAGGLGDLLGKPRGGVGNPRLGVGRGAARGRVTTVG